MPEHEINTSYIIESLRDSCEVLNFMMADLSPHQYYSVTELSKAFPNFTQNKIYRILQTYLSIGWVEKDAKKGKSFKVGHELMYLSHRYLNKLREEQLKIQDEVNTIMRG